jgi:nifR3 family TIM-barrel protein
MTPTKVGLKIGRHNIDFPFILAPMASITNAPFRLLMKELGAGVVVSELVSSTGLNYQGAKTLELCKYFEGERPVGIQIFGEDGNDLSQAAQTLERMGVDFIDINLGCPVPKVVKKGAGAALCRDPRNLYNVLKQVKDSIKIPLTIKIRTGWDAGSVNALECVMAAFEAGVSWVAIHGRTRAQGYEGLANWDYMAEVKSRSPLPIIGNGDVLTAEGAVARLQQSGCDGIMIGRGVLRNPFLFLEIRERMGLALTAVQQSYRRPDGSWDYGALVRRHSELLKKSSNNPIHQGIQLRKFLVWYSAGFDGASQLRKAVFAVPTLDPSSYDEVLSLGLEFYEQPGLKKNMSFLKEPFLQGGHG